MVPVCYEMLSDIITPINLLKKLKAENEHYYILESVENQELWGRYTFLGYSPKLDIICMNGTLTLRMRTEQSSKRPPASIRKSSSVRF